MASLLSRLTGATPFGVQGAGIKSADVSKRLQDAETALKALRLRYAPLAFKAEEGDAEAATGLAKLNQDIRDAEDRVRSLGAALAEAQRIEAMAVEIARENLFQSQAASVRTHLAIMKAAANELAVAESQRAKAWKKLATHADKAVSACPVGFQWRRDTWPNLNRLAAMVRFETYRIGGEGQPSGSASPMSLPGYKIPIGLVNLPDAIKPLTSEIESYCDQIDNDLKAHADGLRRPAG